MPFLLAEILNYQGSAHFIGVGSLSKKVMHKISFRDSRGDFEFFVYAIKLGKRYLESKMWLCYYKTNMLGISSALFDILSE